MTNSKMLQIRRSDGRIVPVRLDLPADGAPISTAILVHAFPAGGTSNVDRIFSRELTRYGIGVAVLDVNGSGEEGEESKTDAGIVEDVESILHQLSVEAAEPVLLIGHARTCRATLTLAQRCRRPPDVALIGADFGEESVPHFHSRDKSLLILHGMTSDPEDSDRTDAFYADADHPKAFIPFAAADQWLSDPVAATYPAVMLGNWARSLADRQQEDVKHREKHDNCTVAVTRRDRYRTEVLSNGHSMVVDEPKELNGTNTGPNPYGLLLASLAACTTITMRMYADRKEWPLESVHVRLTHERVHAEDCDCNADDRSGLLDVIRKYVTIEGDLSQAQRTRLMQIADLCPVHKTLKNQPVIQTTLQGDESVLECI